MKVFLYMKLACKDWERRLFFQITKSFGGGWEGGEGALKEGSDPWDLSYYSEYHKSPISLQGMLNEIKESIQLNWFEISPWKTRCRTFLFWSRFLKDKK